jgi:methyl-accepting chemotaxis protein
MAGPVYRMRQLLEEMGQGDISGSMSHLREKDDFKQLFIDINNVKENWRTRIQELQLACQNIGEGETQKQNLKRINDIAFSFKTKTE